MLGIVEEWEDLGGALGLQHSSIKTDHPGSAKCCLKKIVNYWFENKGEKPPSWKSLCDALRHELVCREDVATKIESNTFAWPVII